MCGGVFGEGYIYILWAGNPCQLSANLSEHVNHAHQVKKKGKTLLNIRYNEPLYHFLMSLKTETQNGIF
jgi:hypothetical protein